MGKQTEIERSIPSLYKRTALMQLMYGYIKGARASLHTITIKQAVKMFMDDFGLDEDSFNSDSAMNTFFRMEKDLITIKKQQ